MLFEVLQPVDIQMRPNPNHPGRLDSHQRLYSSIDSKDRYGASSRTGLYVLMNPYRMRSLKGRRAIASNSRQVWSSLVISIGLIYSDRRITISNELEF